MEGINISAFFIGAATMYFTMWAALTLTRKNRTRYQSVLGGIMALWALFNLKDIIITFPHYYTKEVQDYIILIDGWSAISYTLLIVELTTPNWTTWRRFLLLCIPWALFTLLYILWPADIVLNAYYVFLWCYAWTVVIVAYRKVRRYLKYIRNNFSNIDHIDISWLKYVFWFCIVSQLGWLATSMLYNIYVDAVYYLSTIIMWQMVIHYSYDIQPISIVEETETPMRDYPFADDLKHLMEDGQLYLNQELTLSEVATAVHTNRTYLSSYFNTVMGITFYDYINQLRIEKKAIPMMQEHPEFTLEYIAAESGFKSISTFRRAFHKMKGTGPGQYRRLLSTTTIS